MKGKIQTCTLMKLSECAFFDDEMIYKKHSNIIFACQM